MTQNTTRIEVAVTVFDTRADIRKKRLSNFSFSNKINDLFLLDVYTIDKNFSKEELKKIGSAISNPVTQKFSVKRQALSVKKLHPSFPLPPFHYAIEVGFLPGVTDNVAHTSKEIIEDLLKTKFSGEENVYTSQITFINGDISKNEVQKFAESLYNPLIQRVSIKTRQQFIHDRGMDSIVPKVRITQTPQITEVNLHVSDDELIKIGKEGIKNPDGTRRGPLALDLLFMKTIQKHFKKLGRNPTDIELESLAQTWSEHCKHTIFNDPIDDIKEGLFKTYIKRATEEIRKAKGKNDFCLSVFSDNSGAIAFDDDYAITHKVETHNSPSALDPFGGAVTGIVGVNRDTIGFGLGAKPVANFYGYCFADPRIDNPLYRGQNFTQPMLSSRRIMDGVISGVNSGGNCSGIPTPQGFLYFDERYRGKPLVFVGTVGIIPRKIKNTLSHIKKAQSGNYIVMIGGRVGKDGIHGATFSSEAMDAGSPATSVQLGDPITQKKFSDAIVREARDMLLYNSITDNGAGGLSCSVAEMAKESGGCFVELEKVPLKYPHLEPWEIWISESQERMTLAVQKNKWKIFQDLMNHRGVEATVIGEFTDSGKCVVNYNGKNIMDVDLQFLHNGLPKRPMYSKKPKNLHTSLRTLNNVKGEATPKGSMKPTGLLGYARNDVDVFLSMLSNLNIASYEFISQQYDHVVLGNSMLHPIQGKGRVNGETSVIRPVLTSPKGVVMSQGLYPYYSEIDSYGMAAASIDTAVRNAVAAGANPDYIAILDNFCWCSSNEPERLYQLKQAAKACYDYATVYETPFISGKDSMFNDFKGYDKDGKPIKISVPPTLLITSLGLVDDVKQIVSLDVKIPGDLVYMLGETFDETIPQVNAKKNKKLYDAYYQCIQKGLIASAQSVGRGGLAVALAKTAMGGMLGIKIDLNKLPGKVSQNSFALYSESQGRIIITIAQKNKKDFEKIMAGNASAEVGRVHDNKKFIINGLRVVKIVETTVDDMLKAYRETFKNF